VLDRRLTVNLRKAETVLEISLKDRNGKITCTDLINCINVISNPSLKPEEVYFVEVKWD